MAKEAEMLWTKSNMKELDWLISSDENPAESCKGGFTSRLPMPH